MSHSGHACPGLFPRRHRAYKPSARVEVRTSAMVNAAVIGARGYLGRECMRLLLAHPQVDTLVPVSSSEAGKPYGEAVPSFRGLTSLAFASAGDGKVRDADVVFLATDAEE